MVYGNALSSYQKAQVSGDADPKKLILMAYDGAIKRLNLARKGLEQDDPRMRGENIGKAIAIISELNASLDEKIKTDEINFLRSLYTVMMTELTKVSITKDIQTVDRSIKYLTELKRIWVTTVMNKPEATTARPDNPVKLQNSPDGGGGAYSNYNRTQFKHSIAV